MWQIWSLPQFAWSAYPSRESKGGEGIELAWNFQSTFALLNSTLLLLYDRRRELLLLEKVIRDVADAGKLKRQLADK